MELLCGNCKKELNEKDDHEMVCGNCKKEYDFDYWLNNYDDLPKNVTDLFDNFDGENADYEDSGNLCINLRKIGWDAEFGLDNELFNLHKLDNQPML